ncbi:nicotinate-nucleotide adenylyltransferase [Terrarubrum flagellatum]|uniref:nicotinate-nucleotide adenylyltransferase n=1 Tax=Terrirubrum flagellatum TaxID=2895980 RepID=UPI0031451FB4
MSPPPKLPPHGRRQRIGLLGGTFNPPHEAHVLISLTALKRLKLDAVWWLVTPGNPLKDNHGLPSQEARMAACRALTRDPRIVVTGVEKELGTHYTVDTIAALRRRAPGVKFVWLMGADNLIQFSRWGGWRQIASAIPIAVIDRPKSSLKSLRSRTALALSRWRVPESAASTLPRNRPPAWTFLHGRRSSLSSTALRKAGARVP